MKKIFIIRHAKSSWKDPRLADVERPLNKRGKKDAPMMAKILKHSGEEIDHIILSHSKRTQLTSKAFEKEFDLKSNIRLEPDLYHGYPEDYEEVIQLLDEDYNNVALIGHNPGITILANMCDGNSIDNVPTCGILVLESDVENWSKFSFYNSRIKNFIYPKLYK